MTIRLQYVLFHLQIQVRSITLFFKLSLSTSYISFVFSAFYLKFSSRIFWLWLYINQWKSNFAQWETSCPCSGLRKPFHLVYYRKGTSLLCPSLCGQNVWSLHTSTTRWQWWAKRDNCFACGSASELMFKIKVGNCSNDRVRNRCHCLIFWKYILHREKQNILFSRKYNI